jgi:hypothetical protein
LTFSLSTKAINAWTDLTRKHVISVDCMPLPRQLDVSSASEPYEVRSKYQQAQIEQLSRQCEDLRKQRAIDMERITILEKEQQLQDERANTAMKAIQERWKQEKAKRREDMEIWKSMIAIANLDTRLAQYDGMLEEMRWKEASRQDNIAILAREFKLTEFQVKESENHYTIVELEVSDSLNYSCQYFSIF